jgi:hypothetical protein
VSDEAGSTNAGGRVRARANLNEFLAREQERGSVMPDSLWAAVRAEMAQALCPPFIVPTTVVANAFLMAGAWFLLPRDWFFTVTSPLAFPMVLASWMYSDVPATNVLAPDRIRVMAAVDDPRMLNRLLAAKAAVLWLFVAPFCSLLAVVTAVRHHEPLMIAAAILAICVVPVACLPVAALVGIRWPYHPLQLRYRWDHRQPFGRMVVRWTCLVLVPYVLVPALALLMAVPALVVIIRAHQGNSTVVGFVNSFTETIGIHVDVGGRPLSTAMFVLAVGITCGVAVLTWMVGRWADLRLIRRRRAALEAWLSDPTQG